MIICTNCRRPYPDQGVPYKCPACGGVYDDPDGPILDPSQVDNSLHVIWRYRHTFGLPSSAPLVWLGEGDTPLVWSEAFGRQVAFKMEYLNPTGSFKDRGTAPIISFLKSRGVDRAVEDSSGNAGASFAAYSARAGIKASVYVPASASGPKRKQIEAYGAQVISIPGTRSNAEQAVRQAAEDGSVYASHAWLPFNLAGYATLAYELVGQIGGVPGTVVCPVGQGGLLFGISRGFRAMQKTGLIPRIPVLVGVQAMACAPLWALSRYGLEGLGWVTEGETLAEGVRVRNPLRGDAVLQAVESCGGFFTAVEEQAILAGRDQLALRGLYVEPTSAIVWNALAQLGESVQQPIAVILTGSGFKTGR